MTAEERIRYNKAINVIDSKIIDKRHVVAAPTVEQYNAMQVAVNAMERWMKDTGKPLHRQIAILGYHIANPTALIFKDEYTMDAMEKGCVAIHRMLGVFPDEE